MSVEEQARHELHERLVEVLGDDRASTLMGYLPPVGWADVATKRDLDHLAASNRRDVLELRTEMIEGFGALRTEMTEAFGELRSEMHRELGALRSEIHGELAKHSRSFFLGLIAAVATLTGVAFAAGSLT